MILQARGRVRRRSWLARSRLTVVASLLAASAPLTAANAEEATGGGGDNVVLVFNEADLATRARSALAVSTAAADTVGTDNLAYARARCTDCRTVAVAVQAVLVTGDASVVIPKNAAVAVNENCLRCQTMAAAYQLVLTTDGPVRLSEQGRLQVNLLRGRIAEATASGADFADIEARLDALVAELDTVLAQELRAAGNAVGHDTRKDVRAAA